MKPKPKPKPRGGARAGAGRKKRDTAAVLVRLDPATLKKIDGEVTKRKKAGEKPSPSRGSVIAAKFA